MQITSSVFINGHERGLHVDYEAWLESLASHEPVSQYRHNCTGEDNADARLKRQIAAGATISLDDVLVGREPRAGIVVAAGEHLSAALDTTVTPELEAEGLAREVVKVVQGLRRDAGLDVSDRIHLTWDTASDGLAAAIERHADWIAGEVLAASVARTAAGDEVDVDGTPARFTVSRAGG